MNDRSRRRPSAWLCASLLATAFLSSSLEARQIVQNSANSASQSAASGAHAAPGRVRPVIAGGESSGSAAWWSVLDEIWPPADRKTLTWLAVVLVLALTVQQRASSAVYLVDGVVLALTSVLLLLRRSQIGALPGGQSAQWWSYALLTAAAGYWIVRGFSALFAKRVRVFVTNISIAGGTVLLIAGLLLGLCFIRVSPTSAADMDAIAGGEFVLEHGKLPYGSLEAPAGRSPLVYLLHAGAARVIQPVRNAPEPIGYEATESEAARIGIAQPTTALVNSLLFVLFVLGLAVVGYQRRISGMVATVVAIACFLPWTLESLNKPEIMLASVCVAWSLACLTLPGVGGLLTMLLLVVAGLAWPWAWLLLPLGLCYFLRHGWQAPGAILGLLAGVAGCAALLIGLVDPSPPGDRAMAAAGLTPAHELRQVGTVLQLRPASAATSASAAAQAGEWRQRIWQVLLNREEVTLGRVSRRVEAPAGVDPDQVNLRDVHLTGGRDLLLEDYRAALARMSPSERTVSSLRTVLEDTWLGPQEPPAYESAWDVWRGARDADSWNNIRRYAKLGAGVLSLVLAFLLLRGARPAPFQFAGAATIMLAVTLVVSEGGATMNWIWVLPGILAMMSAGAVSGGTIPPVAAPAAGVKTTGRPAGTIPLASAPRITVE